MNSRICEIKDGTPHVQGVAMDNRAVDGTIHLYQFFPYSIEFQQLRLIKKKVITMQKFKHCYSPLIMGLVLLTGITGCGEKIEDDPQAESVAKWVIGIGGSVKTTTSENKIDQLDRLPKGAWGITYIDLNNTKHKAIDLQKISELKNVKHLGLHSSPLSDQSLSYITGLKSLKELELSNTQISDKGLLVIAEKLPQLEKIFLYDTAPGITDEGVKKFQKKLPQCKVFR
ncbi:hypothetical protein MNBD_PLANCTO02-2593 [hydrothermal vent metagenome]|uniref:Leucine Rich repeats (2 copies) n=1 Tax=hydrothermal vent metagenome TaxID=652676 RepID=A0A3B1E734_9ZZZZ